MALATEVYPHVKDVRVSKTVTFTNVAGNGAQGTVALFTVTGRVLVSLFTAYCSVDLAGASATLIVGTASDTDGFLAITTGTDIDAGDVWTAATPAVGSKGPLVVYTGAFVTSQGPKVLSENIAITVATADLTAGVIEFVVLWTPLSSDGNLVAA